VLERRGDGSTLLRSPQKLGAHARCVTEWLVQWSDRAPDRVFLAERASSGWKTLSYRETYGAVRRVGQCLLEKGLTKDRPVAILSDNSIEHALLSLGAMHVGIPAAPISPATASSFAWVRPARWTCAPSRANARATALPMRPAPP